VVHLKRTLRIVGYFELRSFGSTWLEGLDPRAHKAPDCYASGSTATPSISTCPWKKLGESSQSSESIAFASNSRNSSICSASSRSWRSATES